MPPRPRARPRGILGYPSAFFGARPAANNATGFREIGDPGNARILTIPDPSEGPIGAGLTRTTVADVGFRVVSIEVDVPRGVEAELVLDGTLIHESDDGQGSVGNFELKGSGLTGMPVQRAEATLTNVMAQDLNASYRLIGAVG